MVKAVEADPETIRKLMAGASTGTQ
jgi:hypothetical protein